MINFLTGLSLQTKIFIAIGLFLAGIAAGATATYKIIGWKNDAEELAIKKASEAFVKEYRENESDKAKILQEKLDSLKANEREIIREIPKIINRPVYRNECVDSDGLSAIERARAGKANSDKPS